MAETDAVQEFKEGLTHLRNNYAKKASENFNHALELDPKNPFYLSYLGVALAAGDQKWEEAEDLCYSAVKMKRMQPELYVNLAEVYRLAGKKQDAIDTLMTGLPMTRNDERLIKMLRKLGVRRPPVLSFLERDHVLNKKLGKLRAKILTSMGKEV